ncbi:MAG: hypothetical protein AABW71_04435, partial [Nanoarchaeota archaeon]
ANVSIESPQNIPTIYWIITVITTVLLTCLASIWYFSKAKRSAKEGFKLGITFIIVGFVLDLFFFFTQDNAVEIMKQYYSSTSFYLILALVIVSAIFVGSRHNNSNIVNHTVKKKTRKILKTKPKKRKSQAELIKELIKKSNQ